MFINFLSDEINQKDSFIGYILPSFLTAQPEVHITILINSHLTSRGFSSVTFIQSNKMMITRVFVRGLFAYHGCGWCEAVRDMRMSEERICEQVSG